MIQDKQVNYKIVSSIPSNQIIIPLQKVKNSEKKGFASTASRFTQDKSILMNNLVKKYKNFQQTFKKQNFEDQNSEKKQTVTQTFRIPKKEVETHFIIAQYKANLINISEKYNSQIPKIDTSFNHDVKQQKKQVIKRNHRTLSMPQQIKDLLIQAQNDDGNLSINKDENQNASDKKNEKTSQKYNDSIQTLLKDFSSNNVTKKYRNTYASSFKSQERKLPFLGSLKEQEAHQAPGQYEVQSIFENQKQKQKKYTQNLINQQQENKAKKYNPIEIAKKKIQLVIEDDDNQIIEQDEDSVAKDPKQNNMLKQQNSNKQQYMFMKDDRNRFGEQIYPLTFKDKNPGAGSYHTDQFSIGKKIRQVSIQQEQRKLLKQWLHPDSVEIQ